MSALLKACAATSPPRPWPTARPTHNYDIQGNAIQTQDPLGNMSNVTVDTYGNVPQTATPNGNNNLSTSFSFNTFLAPTSVSQPSNGTSASIDL